MHFCMTILLTIMEPEACLLYRKICENLDVDLEATACVHSLQYSTVQYHVRNISITETRSTIETYNTTNNT